MTTSNKWKAAAAVAAVLALAGCFGGGTDGEDPGVVGPAAVPASAAVSSASFVAYLLSLSAGDETSEPLLIGSTFAVPADETADILPVR